MGQGGLGLLSVITAGPTVSFAASADDVEFYLQNFRAFVKELTDC